MRRYVILGNGPAGINAIEAIRKVDQEGEITNVCAEPYLPYSRPLLPFFIGGQIGEEGVFFRPEDFYREHNVTPVLGEKVLEVDPQREAVITASGRRIPYDQLLIATGGNPRKPKVDGIELKNVNYLTTLDAARDVARQVPDTKSAVIMGGGPLGLKAALSLRHHGIDAKVVVRSPRVMSQVLDGESAVVIEKKLEDSGVGVMTGRDVLALEGNGAVREAVFDDGSRIPCELVIIGKGVTPNLEFLAEAKAIRVNWGIIVNNHLQTSVENVYAAGDVAESYDILSGKSNVVAVWPRASEQGYVAGYNMAGFPKEYVGAHRMNSLDFEGVSCIVMGDVRNIRQDYKVIVQRDKGRNVYQKIILHDGKIRGAAIIGRIVNVGGINRFIRRQINVEAFKSSLLEERSTFIY
jgi:NAD(P)H-nitrite reductase large subunit